MCIGVIPHLAVSKLTGSLGWTMSKTLQNSLQEIMLATQKKVEHTVALGPKVHIHSFISPLWVDRESMRDVCPFRSPPFFWGSLADSAPCTAPGWPLEKQPETFYWNTGCFLLLMVQTYGVHQLMLVAFPILQGFSTSHVVQRCLPSTVGILISWFMN